MSWGGNFDTWLTSGETLYPRFMLKAEVIPGAPGGGGWFDEGAIAVDPVTFQASGVTPQAWSPSVGAFSVDIVTPNIGPILEIIRRGTPLSLMLGREGWDRSLFERIAIGRVTSLGATLRDGGGTTGGGERFRLTCADLFSLPTRFTATASETTLFAEAGSTTTLSSDYTTGASSVDVVSTSAFDRLTGGLYLLKIHPAGGTPFYLTASSKTGTTFTIDTPGADIYGTVRVDATTGDTVTAACLLRGHPLDIVRTILTTTGNGTNGAYDLGVTTWGLALPDALIDHLDVALQRAFVNFASSTYEWSLIIESAWASGYTTLTALLAEAGLFLTVHEGQITCRAVQSLHDPGVGPFYTLGAQDIDARRDVRWEAWDSSVSTEYWSTTIAGPITAAGASVGSAVEAGGTTNISTAPAAVNTERNLASAWHLTSQVCQEVADRVAPWNATIPERLSVPLAGLHHHRLSVGQLVRFSHPTIRSRRTGEPFDQQIGMVVRQAPDWRRGPTVDLAFLPLPSSSQG